MSKPSWIFTSKKLNWWVPRTEVADAEQPDHVFFRDGNGEILHHSLAKQLLISSNCDSVLRSLLESVPSVASYTGSSMKKGKEYLGKYCHNLFLLVSKHTDLTRSLQIL